MSATLKLIKGESAGTMPKLFKGTGENPFPMAYRATREAWFRGSYLKKDELVHICPEGLDIPDWLEAESFF